MAKSRLIIAAIAVIASGFAWAGDREGTMNPQHETRDTLNRTNPSYSDPSLRERCVQGSRWDNSQDGSGSGDPQTAEERKREDARAQDEFQLRIWTSP
jgi:hypothetical protein